MTERRPDQVGVSRPSDPTYIGSRHVEIETMLTKILPRRFHRAPDPPSVVAGTGRPKSYEAEYIAARYVRMVTPPDGFDLDAVEHTRQCRLMRWQGQP